MLELRQLPLKDPAMFRRLDPPGTPFSVLYMVIGAGRATVTVVAIMVVVVPAVGGEGG